MALIHFTWVTVNCFFFHCQKVHQNPRYNEWELTIETDRAAKYYKVTSMSMASLVKPTPLVHRSSHNHSNPTSTSLFLSPVILSFPFYRMTSFLHLRVSAALRSDGDKIGSQESQGFNLLRKPVVSPASRDLDGNSEKDEGESEDDEGWIDWEDKILEDTVPLVGFVRMILHSGR